MMMFWSQEILIVSLTTDMHARTCRIRWITTREEKKTAIAFWDTEKKEDNY